MTIPTIWARSGRSVHADGHPARATAERLGSPRLSPAPTPVADRPNCPGRSHWRQARRVACGKCRPDGRRPRARLAGRPANTRRRLRRRRLPLSSPGYCPIPTWFHGLLAETRRDLATAEPAPAAGADERISTRTLRHRGPTPPQGRRAGPRHPAGSARHRHESRGRGPLGARRRQRRREGGAGSVAATTPGATSTSLAGSWKHVDAVLERTRQRTAPPLRAVPGRPAELRSGRQRPTTARPRPPARPPSRHPATHCCRVLQTWEEWANGDTVPTETLTVTLRALTACGQGRERMPAGARQRPDDRAGGVGMNLHHVEPQRQELELARPGLEL